MTGMSHESDEKAPQSAERVQGVAEQGMDWGKALAAAENRADRAEAERDAALAKVEHLSTLNERLPEVTEGPLRIATAKWPECDRDAYSLAIEEAQSVFRAALADEEPG